MAWTAPKVDWDSIDGVADTDLNEIGDNLVYLKAHVDATTGVHGAVSAATPSTLMIRDANGRAKVAAPSDGGDIVNLTTHNAHAKSTSNPHVVMPIAGGTFTGKAYAQSNTNYTTGQIRNIFFSTDAPTLPQQKATTAIYGCGMRHNGESWLLRNM